MKKKIETSKSKPTPGELLIALVTTATHEKIDDAAISADVSPSIVAGALVQLGFSMLTDERYAELAGTTCGQMLWRVINWGTHRKLHPLAVAPDSVAAEQCLALQANLHCSFDALLGKLIEIAIDYRADHELALLMLGDPVRAMFKVAAYEAAEDWSEEPSMVARLKPGKHPGAFTAFERALANK